MSNSQNPSGTGSLRASNSRSRNQKVGIRWERAIGASLLSLAALIRSEPARAATLTWDPNADLGTTGGSGVWDKGTTARWTNGVVDNLVWTNANDAAFSGSGGGVITIDNTPGAVTVGSLIFDASGYVIGGGPLTLTGNNNITANADATIDAVLAGSGFGFTKLGSGNLTLTANSINTYTGATTITSGTLTVNGSIAAGSLVTVDSAGTLAGNGSILGNATLTGGSINFGATGNIAGTLGVSGGNWNGQGSVTGLVTVSSGNFNIGSAANLTANAGVLVSGGTLSAGGANSTLTGSLNYTSSSASTFAGVIAGATSSVTVNAPAGSLALSAANSYGGATILNAGVLNASVIANGGVNSGLGASSNAASNLIFNGGTLQYTGTAAATTDRLFTIGTAGATIDSSSGTAGSILSFTNTGAIDFIGSGTRNLILTGSNPGTGNNSEWGSGSTIASIIGDGAGGATSLTMNGTGRWALSGTNTYSGGTAVNSGQLAVRSAGALGTGDVNVAAGAQLAFSTASITVANNIILNGLSTVNGATGALVGDNLAGAGINVLTGTLTLAATSNVSTSWSDKSLTITGKVTGPGGLQIDKINAANNASVITLTNGANDYAGGTILNGGSTLNVLAVGALSTGNVTSSGGTLALKLDGNGLGTPETFTFVNPFNITGNTTLSVGRNTASQSANKTLALTGPVSVNSGVSLTLAPSGGYTVSIDTPFASFGSGAILAKSDNGTLKINASNPGSSGAFMINNGVLLLDNPALTSPLGNGGSVTLGATPSANIGGGSAVQLVGGVNISGTTFNFTAGNQESGINFGGGLQSVSGVNTWSGPINSNNTGQYYGADAGATLNLNPSSYTSSANSVQFVGAGAININYVMPLTGAITKFGTGTVTVATASPLFTPAVTINSGTFVVGSAGVGSIGGAGAIAVTNGTFRVDDSTTAVANRLNASAGAARAVNLSGSTFQYIANGAAASSETLGALTSTWGADVVRVDNGAASANSTLTFASLAGNVVSGGSSLVFQSNSDGTGATFGSNANKVIFTTSPTLTNGIIQRGIVFDSTGGTPTYNFATNTGAATSIVAYTAYTANNLATSAATDNVRVTASANLLAGRTFNSLTSSGAGIVVNSSGLQTMTLTSGNILVQSGGLTIGNNLIVAPAAAGNEIGLNVAPGATLDVNGTFSNAFNLTVALGGTVNFNSKQYFNTAGNYLTINGGSTVKLAGGNNTLFPGVQGGAASSNLAVGANSTLDLNGTAQMVGNINSPNSVAFTGTGGTITSTAAATLVNAGGTLGNWGGKITGKVFLNKAGSAAFNVNNDNTFTGGLLLTGGTTTLIESGRFSGLTGSTPININGASLVIANGTNVSNSGVLDLKDRISDAAPIILRAGSIIFNGHASTASSETLGVLTLAQGASQITSNTGGTGVHSAELTFAGFNTGAGYSIDATLNFNGQTAFGNGNTGLAGSNPRILFTAAPTVTNNIVTPQIEYSATDWATYLPGLGLAALNAAGAPGYDGVATAFPAANQPTHNIKLTTASIVPNGGMALNTLILNGVGATFATDADTLNLTAGGLMHTGTGSSLGGAVDNGNLTAGGATPGALVPLYVNNGSGVFTINSRIVDNGASAVRLIVTTYNTGNAVSLTNGLNSYTGGTVVNGWIGNAGAGVTLNGAPGAVVIPAGGLTITNGVVTEVANPGQIHSSNVVTLNGSSTLTLVGANTLDSVVFNNNGGATNPTIATGGALFLTNSTPISVTSSNVGTVPTIAAGGTLDFANTPKTLAIDATTVNGQAVAPLTAGLNIAAVIQNSGLITKTGTGNLQLSAQNTFTGGVTLSQGGLILGASSTPSTFGAVVTSGPVGTGTLTAASGTTLLSSGAVTIANPLTIQGNLNFDGLNNITFNGTTTFPVAPFTINVAAPQQTITMQGTLVNPGTPLTKTGFGTLAINGYQGGISLPSGGNLTLLNDGDGTGTPENLAYGVLSAGAGANLTIGRSTFAYTPYFQFAGNKTYQFSSLAAGGGTFAVTNNNGYGIQITGATTWGAADQVFSVANATASNVVQGLTLSGVASGGGGIVKQGAGTLALTNAGNTFGGAGKLIDIQGGVVAASSDGALGDAANGIKINTNAATAAGFRATGTFSTGRTVTLAQAANAIEVTAGNTLTLTTPFALGAAGNGLTKNDNGVLELSVANAGWTGPITINAGAVRVSQTGALGSGAISISPSAAVPGAALQLSGGVTVSNALTLQGNNNTLLGGLNFGGQLQSVSGVNTYSGAITTAFDAAIGADAGSTLNITGGINDNTANRQIWFTGAGNVNISGTALSFTAAATGFAGIQKYGSGTLTISNANTAPISDATIGLRVNAGSVVFSGAGTFAGGPTAPVFVLPGGTLTLDNSGTVVASRLGGRPITLSGGNVNLIGGGTATTETFGAPVFNRGQTTITVTNGGAGTDLRFSAASNSVTPAQTTAGSGATALFRGTNLGAAAGAANSTIAWTAGGLLTNGQTGATGTTTKSIVPWAIIDNTATGLGTSFVTADTAAAATNTGTAILRALNASEYSNTAALVANTNSLINTTSGSIAGQGTIAPNSLTFDNNTSITMNAGATLSLSSGGILVRNGSASSISGGVASQPAANSPWSIHTVGTGSLTISSVMNGGNANSSVGLAKAGGGTLTLSTPTLTIPGLAGVSANTLNMQTALNQGTLVLNGGTNPLGVNNYLAVGAGATLDLKGSSQYVLGLFTDGAVNGIANTVTAGGTITSSVGAGTIVSNSDARNWAGTITGNVFYNRTGSVSTTTIYTPQTYTGGTLINGGTVSLRDYGTLANTSAIDVNYAFLSLDNTQAAGISGRLGTAPITLRGATLTYAGRAQTASTETIGSVGIAEGWNNLTVTNGGTGVNSSDLTIAALTHPAGSAGVVNLANANGNAQQTGQLGSVSRLLIATPPTLSQNIIGAWAIASREWASYVPGLGTGKLNDPGFAGYMTNLATASATDNVRITATPGVLTGNTTVNTLNVNFAANTIVDLGGNTLTLASGGLILATGTNATSATISNGNLTSGALNVGGDLYAYHLPYAGTTRLAVIGAKVVDNGIGAVRLIVSSSEIAGTAQTVTLNGVNTNSGGYVFNLGTTVVGATGSLNFGGITLNSANLNQSASGQATPGTINSANVVTLNGPSSLNLVNNNTLAGLVFNNNGATSNGAGATSVNAGPTVNSFIGGLGTAGTGTLMIGANGIVANSSNVATTSTIAGRLDTGAVPTTLTINPILVNGVAVAPLSPTLQIQGWTGSASEITKAGTGVLQLNAQSNFTGTINVTGGGIGFGTLGLLGLAAGNAPGSRYSQINLSANTFVNLTNADVTIGSIAGAGSVINLASTGATAGRTFNVGFDGTSTIFSGSFARTTDALLNPYQVNKIGAGTMTLTGVSTTTNNLQVSQGGVTYSGLGTGVFGTTIVLPTGTLTLDNSGTNVNHRLTGGAGTGGALQVSGGTVRIVGNSTTATSETIGTLSFSATSNPGGTGTITLQADPARSLTFTVGTAFTAVGTAVDSGLIRGISNTVGAGFANFNLGAVALGASAGSGTGLNGTTTMAIRPDLLGDASASGVGTGFITKDTTSNFLRPLAASELSSTVISGATTSTTNYGLSSVASLGAGGTFGSMTLNSGGGVNLPFAVSASAAEGLPVNPQVFSGGILAFTGNAGINVGRIQTANNLPFYIHTVGNLSVTGVLNGTTGGLVKADGGTLTLNSRNLYTGQTNVNGGTLVLNGGDNTLPVFATGGAPSVLATGVHSGTLDLNGNNQLVGTLFDNGLARYANNGGTVTNTAAGAPVTLTTTVGTAFTFGGSVAGNLNFTKTGNVAMAMASANTFTGATNIRANTLTLIDGGTLANTSAVNLFYGGLAVDQSGLNPIGNINPQRINAAAAVNLNAGTLSLIAGGSADYVQNVTTVNALQGHSTISLPLGTPAGSTAAFNIGNLAVSSDATINLSGGPTGNFFNAAPGFGISNLFLGNVNGNSISANIANKILPANIIVNNGEFATYVQSGTTGSGGLNYGIVTMNSGITAVAQTQYDSNIATLPASNANSNVRLTTAATVAVPVGGATYNVLALRAAGITLSFTAGDTLNLTAGGLALTNGTAVVGSAVGNGFVTSGGPATSGTFPLYVHSNGAIFNSAIKDNGTGAATRLVVNSFAGTLTVAGANTYTGGTVVNGGSIVALTGVGAIPAGGLTINGSTVTTSAQNQIATTNNVTLNGSSTLTLGNFANTLNSLSFNNTGGATNPAVAVGTVGLTLSGTNAITAVNDNAATVPTISGTFLTLAPGANINTSTTANVPTNLVITAPIVTSGALNKTGTGSLVLAPVNVTLTGSSTVNGSSTVTVPATAALAVGQGVSGAGIPAGATISSITNGTTIVISAPATASTGTYAGLTTTSGNATVTIASTAGLAVGQTITGLGIPANATIASIPTGTTFTLSANATATVGNFAGLVSTGTTTVTLTSTTGLIAGQSVSGLNIPAGATVVSVTAGSAVLSIAVPAGTGGTLVTAPTTGTVAVTGTAGGNVIAGGFNLSSGTVILGSSSVSGVGPLGAGTVTMADGTAMISDSAIRTIANPIVIDGNITFGSTAGIANASAVAANGVILSGPVSLGSGNNRAINVNSFLNTSTMSGIVSGTGSSLTKTGPGTLVLTGVNTFDGGVNINAGVLQTNATGLGTAGTISFGGGVLQYAASTNTDFSSRISTANNQPFFIDTNGNTVTYTTALTSATGGSLSKFGTGNLILQGAPSYTGVTNITAGVLQVGTGATSTGTINLTSSSLLNSGTFYLNAKTAGESVTFGTGSGTGGITIDQGTVAFTADSAFGGTLLFGATPAGSSTLANGTGTVGILDATTANMTFGAITAQANSPAPNVNVIKIGTGKTLTVTGNLTVGFNPNSTTLTSNSALTINGGGSLVLNGAAAIVNVGVHDSQQAGTSTTNTLDVSTLSSVNFGTIAAPITTLNVSFGQTAAGTLTLSNTANTIAATTLNVGHSNLLNGGPGLLTLGTGTNAINADTINIGFSKAFGTISFASQVANSLGTVTIGNKAGTAGADINVGSQFATGTAAAQVGLLDLRGHLSTVTANNVTVGNNNGTSLASGASGVINFDTGTFTANVLNLGLRSGASTGSNTLANAVNLSGGTFTVANATTISNNTVATAITGNVTSNLAVSGGTFTTGTINAAVKSGLGTGSAIANINVSGGNLNVTGASFVLASQATGGTAVGSLNITGGTVTTAADITDGGGAATTSISLNGANATLDMTGKKIGSVGTPIDTVTFAAGTLKNLADINGGANLVKTTAGVLTLAGTNTYPSQTQVNAGTLRLTSGAGNTVASSLVNIANGATLSVTDASLTATLGGATGLNFGAPASAQTFSLVSLTGNTLSTVNPVIDLTNASATLTADGITTVNAPDIAYAAGATYPLIRSNNLIAGASPFTLGTTASRIATGGITLDGTNKILQLSVTSVYTPSWDGAVAGQIWDVNTTQNWKVGPSNTPTKYFAGEGVTFDDSATNANVVLNTNVTPATVTFNNTLKPYTLSGTGQINGTTGVTKTGDNSVTVSNTNLYTGPTAVNAGTFRVDGSIAGSSGVTVASGAKFATGSTQTVKSLALAEGGSAELASAALSVLTVGNNVNTTPFSMGVTSTLDMHKNVLIVDYPTGSSPIAAVRASIVTAYNGGTWTGVNGIGSTEVTASTVTAPLLAIGYAEATSLIGGAGTINFGGLTPTSANVDATSLIVRTTLSGDADLDGTVNLNDLIRLANNYGTATGLNWSDGDFDYSGGVDLNDLIRLANNYGSIFAAGEVIPGAGDSFNADLAAAFNGTAQPVGVPEPTTLGLAAVGAAGMLMRRRRRA